MNKVTFMRTKKESSTSTNEFWRRFKSDMSINPANVIPLSRDVKDVDNDPLTMEVSDAKIFEAMNKVNPLKAPCPDGMEAIFYHKNWTIISKLVCNIVRLFCGTYVKRTIQDMHYSKLITRIV